MSLRGAAAAARRAAPFAGLLGAWGAASALGWVDKFVLPPPWEVLRAAAGFVTGYGWASPYSGQFSLHAAATLARVGAGFFLAAAAGVAGGVMSARSPRFNRLVDPLVHLFRAVPGIAWLPVAMVWFGIGDRTAIFLIGLAAFFPVYVNALHGVREVPVEWLRAARMLGASPRQVVLRVVLPGALPAIEAGLRVALGVAWAYVVLGELTGVERGLGAMIMDARMMGDLTTVLVGVVSIAVLGRASDWAMVRLLRFASGPRR